MDQIKEQIERILYATHRDGIVQVLQHLDEEGFFTAPASASNHLNTAGGLAMHSLSVYNVAVKLYKNIYAKDDDVIKEDLIPIAITALLHDVCKCDGYIYDEKKKKYIKNPDSTPFGHGEKSVIKLLQWGLKLTDEEIAAIRWHMGAWCLDRNSLIETGDYNSAKKMYPLLTIIETADFLSSNLCEE